jgi:hypothetical protein
VRGIISAPVRGRTLVVHWLLSLSYTGFTLWSGMWIFGGDTSKKKKNILSERNEGQGKVCTP